MAVVRRRALWVLIAAKLLAGWGVGWDIRWHVLIGRDSFWIAPHVMTYAGVGVLALVSFAVLLADTWRARRRSADADTVRLAGLVGTRGWHLAWWGMALVILAAPIDDLWHRLFGIDVTLWSPPHLLGLIGSQINSLGMLLIALEEWPEGRITRTATLLTIGKGRVARLRNRMAKQVLQVSVSEAAPFHEPSGFWTFRSSWAPSAYHSWAPMRSVPVRSAARSRE